MIQLHIIPKGDLLNFLKAKYLSRDFPMTIKVFFSALLSDSARIPISRFQCMPELELETVFEAGSPVISPDPSGSMEAEDDDDGCTNSIENGITTKCQIRNSNIRLSADHSISMS